MVELNRLPPAGPVTAYKTYSISAPLGTHYRPASCAEVGCEAYEKGWVTRVPVAETDMIDFILSGAHGRHFVETTEIQGAEREFMFGPGQMCFRASQHRVSLERPALYRVRGGDWRQNLGLIRQHTRPDHWVEDFAEHQDKIAKVVNG